MREAVIVASSRTPLAKSHRGSFNMTRPDELAAQVIRHVMDKVPALDAAPRQIIDGLSAVALEEGAALEELVHGLMPLRLLSRRLLSSETFRIIAAAVPGSFPG